MAQALARPEVVWVKFHRMVKDKDNTGDAGERERERDSVLTS